MHGGNNFGPQMHGISNMNDMNKFYDGPRIRIIDKSPKVGDKYGIKSMGKKALKNKIA
jgi:hypothetical protein